MEKNSQARNIEGVVEKEGPVLTAEFLKRFAAAVSSPEEGQFCPTLATFYRIAEFAWLEKLGISLKDLLHVDQAYEYLEDFAMNDKTRMVTRVVRYRERPSGSFLVLETDVVADGKTKVITTTTFMIRGA